MPFTGLNRTQVNTLIEAALTPYTTSSDLATLMAGKAAVDHTHDYSLVFAPLAHTHDDRYFTESEVTTLMANKSDTGHTHDYSLVFAALVHAHDDLYFTESEVTALLAGKADSSTAVTLAGSQTLTNKIIELAVATSAAADSGTNDIVDAITIKRNSSGTPAVNYGTGILFRLKSSTTADRDAARIRTQWSTATDGTRTSKLTISTVKSGVEADAFVINSTSYQFNHQGASTAASLRIEEINPDGRQKLMHYSDGSSGQIMQLRGGFGNKGIALGPASTAAGEGGVTGNIALATQYTLISQAFFGSAGLNVATHKSFAITTPEQAATQLGTWTRTDMVDLITTSTASNTWGGTRPNLRYTALEHLFRTNNGTGQNNPGTDIFRVQDTGVRVESTLAFHLGDPTVDGTWRFTRSGNNLLAQRRETGAWVTKQTISA